jgi:hypothetical protein
VRHVVVADDGHRRFAIARVEIQDMRMTAAISMLR